VVRVRVVAHRTLVAAPAPRAGEHVVRSGDTLSAIAARYRMTWPALWALHRDRVADPELIYPGEVLRVLV
jgi:nucleoid-associated protein YgaU